MFKDSAIFEEHYHDYLRQISEIELANRKDILGVEYHDNRAIVPFFTKKYAISKEGIVDASGKRPHYAVCVILAKYILLSPHMVHHDPAWVSFKDFKQTSHFLNVNYFSSDVERALERNFSGKRNALINACKELGGYDQEGQFPYDVSMSFEALPRVSLLMLFNDRDEEFPARCSVLFQKHSEFYLDPESLAMTGGYLSKRLQRVTG